MVFFRNFPSECVFFHRQNQPGRQLPPRSGFPCGVKRPRRCQRGSSPTGGSSQDPWGCLPKAPHGEGGTAAVIRGAAGAVIPERDGQQAPLGAASRLSAESRGKEGTHLLASSSAPPGPSKGSCPSAATSGLETAAAIPTCGRSRAP